mmetsp:Transcript_24039/g.62183  ORF Transcript_24039/g.62183 Transcript_24039/m.62183 type:complete len:240 (-) Transcript_24039:233-952(-)
MLTSKLGAARLLTPKNSVKLAPKAQRNVAAMGLMDSLFGGGSSEPKTKLAPKEAQIPGCKLATFACGCFWGPELLYQRVPGVEATSVGYTAGSKPGPSYQEVCSGNTGHTEAVQVTYNPTQVTYDQLLDTFFGFTDPTTKNRQGNDTGPQYRSGIYFHDEEQKAAALKRVAEVNEKLARGEQVRPNKPYAGKVVVSEIAPAGDYWIAEDYHQQYLSKGGRFGAGQSAAKGCTDPIRCYG